MASVLAGCPSSGLIKYEDPPPEEADPLTLDQCPELCAVAIDAGCTVLDCDIDVARDWELGIDILVFHLDGASDGGGGCEMVVQCPVIDDCVLAYQSCVDDIGDVDFCNEQYEFCVRAPVCEESKSTCELGVEAQRDWCLDNTPDADCSAEYMIGMDFCQCLYDDCLTDETLDCVPAQAAALISPPIQTGPQAWTVSRAFIDQQLARLDALSVEVLAWPVPTADNHAWRGLKLSSIDASEPLHQLGLRDGDVVRTINGQSLVSMVANNAALLQLRDAASVTLGVERARTVRQFKYKLVN